MRRKLECWGCTQSGCDGHELEIEYYHTTNHVIIRIGGEERLCVDQGTWDVILEADKSYREAR